jgi:hypothetical protein
MRRPGLGFAQTCVTRSPVRYAELRKTAGSAKESLR